MIIKIMFLYAGWYSMEEEVYMLRVAFWGFGSIAKRHIKNLRDVLTERSICYMIDVYRHNDADISDKEIKRIVSAVYLQQDIADRQYDIIFITNPTSMHYEAVRLCVKHAKHMFIEKPVFDNFDYDISKLGLKKDFVYYVACPLRYMKVLQYIKKMNFAGNVISARAISSSYLPDWREGNDYRQSYSANRELGGGVDIDLIHEWDYLIDLFGFPDKVFNVSGKYSALEINSADLAVYLGVYSDKLLEVHLDYFGRKPIRELLLLTDSDSVLADLIKGTISFQRTGEVIDLYEERDIYQKRELSYFLDMVFNKADNSNSLEHALQVLKVAIGQKGKKK